MSFFETLGWEDWDEPTDWNGYWWAESPELKIKHQAARRLTSAERRKELSKAGLLRCDRCPYHRNENSKRKARSDVLKSHRAERRLKEKDRS